jgi:hypothetical protein
MGGYHGYGQGGGLGSSGTEPQLKRGGIWVGRGYEGMWGLEVWRYGG